MYVAVYVLFALYDRAADGAASDHFWTLQLFKNCLGPFLRLQSFRNGLLQHGSPVGTWVLTENVLPCLF